MLYFDLQFRNHYTTQTRHEWTPNKLSSFILVFNTVCLQLYPSSGLAKCNNYPRSCHIERYTCKLFVLDGMLVTIGLVLDISLSIKGPKYNSVSCLVYFKE